MVDMDDICLVYTYEHVTLFTATSAGMQAVSGLPPRPVRALPSK